MKSSLRVEIIVTLSPWVTPGAFFIVLKSIRSYFRIISAKVVVDFILK